MFYLFAGENFYPSGGAFDYVGQYPTQDAAKEAVQGDATDWAHIVVPTDKGLRMVARGLRNGKWIWQDVEREDNDHYLEVFRP